ncbi:MAG: glycosyltransferase family 2 protein [Defluviitaleaceae bacterium]|nr:glycosyltransferase family 2 protein [Defluviitaleaceae bacterium]
MLLTIGMIVKNESKYLRECLTAMQPILENVPSELIIADTGSTDDTVEIAKSFTDNVLEIEWENNFSKARNATLRPAKGKWYMFVDADEIFDKTQGLIDFFTSGEYQKYEYAGITIRNVIGNHRGDAVINRLFRKRKERIFIGSIHERVQLQGKAPFVLPDTMLLHHGYDFTGEDGDELKSAKMDRNLTLLNKEYEKRPKDLGLLHYMVRENRSAGNFEEAKGYLDKAMRLMPENTRGNNVLYSIFTHHAIALCRHPEVDHRAICDVLEEYFNTIKTTFRISFVLRQAHANALLALHEYSQAARVYEQCIDMYENYDSLDMRSSFYVPAEEVTPQTQNTLINRAIFCYACAEDYESANAVERPKRLDVRTFWAFRNTLKSENPQVIYNVLNYLVQSHKNTLPQEFGSLILLPMQKDKGPESVEGVNEVINSLKISHTKKTVAFIIKTFGDEFKEAFLKFVKENDYLDSSEEIKTLRLLYELAYMLFLMEKDEPTREEFFEAYARTYYRYLTVTHREEALSEERIVGLDENATFGYYSGVAYKNKSNGSDLDFIRTLRKAMGFNQNGMLLVLPFVKRIEDKIKEAAAAEEEAKKAAALEVAPIAIQEEAPVPSQTVDQLLQAMQQQFVTLKTSIQGLITANPQQAGRLLAQYESINPTDPDIALLKEKLELGAVGVGVR